MTSTTNYWDNIERVKEFLNTADAVLVGIGAGMSTAAGLTYSGERFHKYFDDFHKKYGITDMYSGGFYSFESMEEYWAWWSRHIYYNRYDISNYFHNYHCLKFNFYPKSIFSCWRSASPCNTIRIFRVCPCVFGNCPQVTSTAINSYAIEKFNLINCFF